MYWTPVSSVLWRLPFSPGRGGRGVKKGAAGSRTFETADHMCSLITVTGNCGYCCLRLEARASKEPPKCHEGISPEELLVFSIQANLTVKSPHPEDWLSFRH